MTILTSNENTQTHWKVNAPPSRCPEPVNFIWHGRRDFEDMIKVMEFDMERESWLIKVGPTKLQESLKVKNLFQPWLV